jgi:DNA-directed RNA polymerase subunit RPC12/RpoP
MKCPNCNSKIQYRDSIQQPDGTDAYRCTNCGRISKAKHGLPFYLLIFAIIVPLGNLVLIGIVESVFSATWRGDAPGQDTARLVSLAVSVILFLAVYRVLDKLECVDEIDSDSADRP